MKFYHSFLSSPNFTTDWFVFVPGHTCEQAVTAGAFLSLTPVYPTQAVQAWCFPSEMQQPGVVTVHACCPLFTRSEHFGQYKQSCRRYSIES